VAPSSIFQLKIIEEANPPTAFTGVNNRGAAGETTGSQTLHEAIREQYFVPAVLNEPLTYNFPENRLKTIDET
jgi:hypothetical protein